MRRFHVLDLMPNQPQLDPESETKTRRGLLKRFLGLFAGGALLIGATSAVGASRFNSQMNMAAEPFIGEICMYGFNFAPRGWATCDGQLISIAQNTALFSLLGTTFGGNGQTTFGLPDLRGRVAIHQGTGPGLSSKTMGEASGVENVTLISAQMPTHTHQLIADANPGSSDLPGSNLIARSPAGIPDFGTGTGAVMSPSSIGTTGGNQPHPNMQPYLVVNFCIALEGIFPSRN